MAGIDRGSRMTPADGLADSLTGAADAVRTLGELAALLRQLRRREARQRDDSARTYRALAARTGWSHGVIGAYFAGTTLPPTDRFDALVGLLGASPVEQRALATARDRVDEARRTRPAAVAARVPWQPPAPVPGFVGRAEQLAAVGRAGPVCLVSGTAGVGKTALAVQWAHRSRGRFPDGCLFVDLRGYAPREPLTVPEAMAHILRGLDLSAADAADEAQYRSLLAGRRLLVVLDNARCAEQVRPLLPGTDSCFVLITSRDAMAGLVARDGACRVDLDLLPLDDAVLLLRALLGSVPGTGATLTALAEQCARLPLALRIAAELAVSRSLVPLEALVGELASQRGRMDALDAGGDSGTAVRAVFSWSYRQLDPAAATVFRLLGVVPTGEIGSVALAALVGLPERQARRLLDQLVRAHLVQAVARDRYGLHDLLRAYAAELAAAAGESELASRRLRGHYLRHTGPYEVGAAGAGAWQRSSAACSVVRSAEVTVSW